MSILICRPKSLPLDKLAAAEQHAIEVNPANASELRAVVRTPIGRRRGARRIAVLVARKWPETGVRLSVSFLDGAKVELRARILEHMNAWGKSANVLFSETNGKGEVRIARLDSPPDMAGYWSYLGTEILEIPEGEPTLNLEGFTMRTAEAEFRRVVRHEAGHTLGFEHEHMRSDIVEKIDRSKAIAFFDRDQGWTEQEVEEQVLTPLAKRSLMGTRESDPLSIMCYQLPGKIMKDGRAIAGGKDINPRDAAFAASLYPKPSRRPARESEVVETVSGPLLVRDEEDRDAFHLVVMDEFKPEATPRGSRVLLPESAQVFASYGGARVTFPMRLRAKKDGTEKTRFGRIIDMHERIKAYTNREAGSQPTDEELIAFGSDLFETLFQGDVRRLYDEARTRQGRARLDLVLTSMIPWIGEKPWEFAYDPGRKCFLATEEIHFVRNVLTNVPSDRLVRTSGPLRILVAAAQPVGFGRLSTDQEVAVIRRGFEGLIEAGLVELDVLARATPSQIHGYLSTGFYQVMHFIGHGMYDEERREGCLVFETEPGTEYPLGEREVREIFRGRGLALVFLNACESGRAGRADFNKGVAQSLVAHGLPAVVANQYSVLDSSATAFAQHFYWALAQGMELGQAAREARIAVNYSLNGEPIDWAVPVLYARDACMTLCTPPVVRTRTPVSSVRATGRRAGGARAARVAVWDMDDVFPGLERTLAVLNAVQGIFGFELADLSVPFDVWDLETDRECPYLVAERLAERLRTKPSTLRVDVLVCVTRHWMRGGEWLNLYCWWPGGGKPPILAFSAAGFDELEPEGPRTDRAIANGLVASLGGFYGDIDSHDGGSQACPLWFNEERVFAHLVARQQFDARCRKALSPRLGSKLAALDALLGAFHEPATNEAPEDGAETTRRTTRRKKHGRQKTRRK